MVDGMGGTGGTPGSGGAVIFGVALLAEALLTRLRYRDMERSIEF